MKKFNYDGLQLLEKGNYNLDVVITIFLKTHDFGSITHIIVVHDAVL